MVPTKRTQKFVLFTLLALILVSAPQHAQANIWTLVTTLFGSSTTRPTQQASAAATTSSTAQASSSSAQSTTTSGSNQGLLSRVVNKTFSLIAGLCKLLFKPFKRLFAFFSRPAERTAQYQNISVITAAQPPQEPLQPQSVVNSSSSESQQRSSQAPPSTQPRQMQPDEKSEKVQAQLRLATLRAQPRKAMVTFEGVSSDCIINIGNTTNLEPDNQSNEGPDWESNESEATGSDTTTQAAPTTSSPEHASRLARVTSWLRNYVSANPTQDNEGIVIANESTTNTNSVENANLAAQQQNPLRRTSFWNSVKNSFYAMTGSVINALNNNNATDLNLGATPSYQTNVDNVPTTAITSSEIKNALASLDSDTESSAEQEPPQQQTKANVNNSSSESTQQRSSQAPLPQVPLDNDERPDNEDAPEERGQATTPRTTRAVTFEDVTNEEHNNQSNKGSNWKPKVSSTVTQDASAAAMSEVESTITAFLNCTSACSAQDNEGIVIANESTTNTNPVKNANLAAQQQNPSRCTTLLNSVKSTFYAMISSVFNVLRRKNDNDSVVTSSEINNGIPQDTSDTESGIDPDDEYLDCLDDDNENKAETTVRLHPKSPRATQSALTTIAVATLLTANPT